MRAILLVLAVAFCICATAQFPYNPLPFKKSDFKKINEKGYTVLKVYVVDDDFKELATVIEYGAEGLIATMFDKGTNDEGDTINKMETYYKFDGKGRLITKTINDIESGDGEEVTMYTYDGNGKLIKKETASIDPPTYKYKYNAAGKLSEVYVTQKMPLYDEEGEFHGKTVEKPSNRYVYKYDAKGRLSEEWDFNLSSGEKSTKQDYKTTWTYNNKGQIVKVRRTNSDAAEMYVETYEYNADGLISSRTFDNGDGVIRYVYEYCKGCKQSWMSGD